MPYLTSTDTLKIQYQKDAETRCIDSQKPKTQIKMKDTKKYRAIYCMNDLIGYKNSGRIWLMKVLQQSLGETQSKEVMTLPSHLMNYQWSREQKWNRVQVSVVSTLIFRKTQIAIPA